MSHALWAPLLHISGFVNILVKEAVAHLKGESREHLRLIRQVARQMGSRMVVARDRAEAMDCLQHPDKYGISEHLSPQLMLLDLKMPGMDGLEVLKQMKSDTQLRSVEVVIFSSSREESDVTSCYELGANAYVVKPTDFQEFSRVLTLVGEFWLRISEPSPLGLIAEPVGRGHVVVAA